MVEGYSDRLDLPLLHAGQAQKELFHNEALAILDMLVQASIETDALASAPGAPTHGQCWLVGSGASGDWAGHDGDIVCWTSSGWRFAAPVHGMRVWVRDAGHAMIYDGTTWTAEAVQPDGYYVAGTRVLSERQPAISDPAGGEVIDIEGRTVISAILSMLRMHGLTA